MSPIISRAVFSKGFGRLLGALPTYSISPDTSSVNEGSSVTFTITTTNVANGTTLYWSTNTVSGTVNASDFSDAQTTGSFTITNNSGTVIRTLSNDITVEGSESFQLQIRTGSTSGAIVATSTTVTINDTSPLIDASGGTIVDDAGYRMHIFTSPGSFVVTNAGPGTVEYLVVAGGGGGNIPPSGNSGGAGGAGGFRTATGFPITATTYPITVGGGGSSGVNGNPSIFSTITSTGGGAGGAGSGYAGSPGNSGGSGGGGGGGGYGGSGVGGTGNTPPTTPPQGNPGGNGVFGGDGGGGGGAGAPGTIGPAGPGGIGSPITWIPASYGTPGPTPGRYFAGGGGASTGTGGAGGGGGNGSTGTTNTGGGGGSGNSGGSGIVVIRYLL